jgi:hypothetical protein
VTEVFEWVEFSTTDAGPEMEIAEDQTEELHRTLTSVGLPRYSRDDQNCDKVLQFLSTVSPGFMCHHDSRGAVRFGR